ncbi:MAG: hypothetical protein WDN28_33005 [Chthoniobacter sp.]
MSALTSLAKSARGIVQRLQDAGHIAYYAGGCVRDQLMGVQPHDFDIATNAHPEQVQKLFRRTVAVGAHFGVIVVLDGSFEFQVATFRNDGQYLDGRRPESVSFATPEEDAARRDFTINGLFFDPIAERLIDYVGGQEESRQEDAARHRQSLRPFSRGPAAPAARRALRHHAGLRSRWRHMAGRLRKCAAYQRGQCRADSRGTGEDLSLAPAGPRLRSAR